MSRKFNLTLFRPDHPRFRIMDSHLEVMASLQWGFEALGLDCSISVNAVDRSRTNILFGWIVANQMGALRDLPADTILYNFEQFSELPIETTGVGQLAQRFQIWDYSAANLPRWEACQPKWPPFHAPVSYAPNLQRITARPAAEADLDLVYIGSGGTGRHAKLDEIAGTLSRPGIVMLQNVWGEARDAFIARSKLLLNLSNDNPAMRIFEIVRVSYYLANRRAVVCELVEGQHIEQDMEHALLRVPREELGSTCERLLQDTVERERWAEQGHEAFRQRDVRRVIRQFLG